MDLAGISTSHLKLMCSGMGGSIRQVLHQLLMATLTKILMALVLPQTFMSIVSSCPCIQLQQVRCFYLAQLILENEKYFIKLCGNVNG